MIGLMKDEFGGQIVKKFVGLRAKHIAIFNAMMMNIKKQKGEKSVL